MYGVKFESEKKEVIDKIIEGVDNMSKMKDYLIDKERAERVGCFECKEPFTLELDHAKNFADSGLCPQCFNKTMGWNPTEELLAEIIIILKRILDEVKK